MQILNDWAKRSASSPRRVMIILVVVMAASLYLASGLEVGTDISVLMPQHSRASGALLEIFDEYGTSERLILAVESTKPGEGSLIANRLQLKELARRLAAAMDETGLFSTIAYRVKTAEREFFEDLHFRHPFHFLQPGQLPAVARKLAPQAIAQRISDTTRSLRTSPFDATTHSQLMRDPLGFRSDLRIGYDHDNLTGFNLDLSDGHFFSADGSTILILARPREASQNTTFDVRLVGELEDLLATLGGSGTFGPNYAMSVGPDLSVQLLGPYVETLYGSQAAEKEILPSAAVTLVGLLILFAVVYRSAAALLVLVVPLLAGIIATGGVAALYPGHLTMITVGFAAMLAGLGIDFEIHLIERIRQESLASGIRESIGRAFATTGRGVLAGAVTSVAIFGLIATSDFAALREFGWIVGVGIVLTMISMFALLPVLIESFPASLRSRGLTIDPAWASWVLSRCRGVIATAVVVTVPLGYAASMLKIESNIYDLGAMNARYEQDKDRIMRKVGGSTNVAMVVAQSQDLQDLLLLSEQIKSSLEALRASGEIDGFESVSSILRSRSSQQANFETVRAWDLDGAMTSLRSALEESGMRTMPFEPFINNVLAYRSGKAEYLGLEQFEGTPVGPLLDRFLAPGATGWKVVAYLYPPAGRWEDEVPAAVVDSLEGLGEGVILTGIVPSFNEIARQIGEEFAELAVLALIAVLIISLLFFRTPLISVLSTVPAVIGLIWTLGLMKLCGIELNLITLLVAPMIVGLGVDDALHVLNRHRENPAGLATTMEAVSRAVLMTTATTVIGFGSLALADLPSLQALGISVSIGMLCCAVSSLVLLPALLSALGARN